MPAKDKQDWANERISQGLCVDCPNQIEYPISKRRCKACCERANEIRRENRHKRVQVGKCHVANCENTVEEGKHKCSGCRGKDANRILNRIQGFRDLGLCCQCGKNPPLQDQVSNSQPVCEDCWFSRVSQNTFGNRRHRDQLKALLIKQNYTCPYTGNKLVPGLNASVDHKNPVLRFSSQVHDWNNLEWVDLEVNLAKRDRTKEEFLKFVKTIYKLNF